MNPTLFANAGYVIALTACFAGVYLWKRAKILAAELEAVQTKANLQNASLSDKTTQLETLIASKDNLLLQKNREMLEIEKSREILVKEHSDAVKTLQDRFRSLENQLEHYKAQTEALLSQIRELDSENAVLKKTLERDLQEKTESLKAENKQLQESSSHSESQLKTLQTRLSELQVAQRENADLLNRLKRKTYQSDHLYKTIRGQKEMLEERLENWEKALRLLSLWVLRSQEQTVSASASLGEIVASALQCSKQGSLMCDDVEMDLDIKPTIETPLAEGEVRV